MEWEIKKSLLIGGVRKVGQHFSGGSGRGMMNRIIKRKEEDLDASPIFGWGDQRKGRLATTLDK